MFETNSFRCLCWTSTVVKTIFFNVIRKYVWCFRNLKSQMEKLIYDKKPITIVRIAMAPVIESEIFPRGGGNRLFCHSLSLPPRQKIRFWVRDARTDNRTCQYVRQWVLVCVDTTQFVRHAAKSRLRNALRTGVLFARTRTVSRAFTDERLPVI